MIQRRAIWETLLEMVWPRFYKPQHPKYLGSLDDRRISVLGKHCLYKLAAASPASLDRESAFRLDPFKTGHPFNSVSSRPPERLPFTSRLEKLAGSPQQITREVNLKQHRGTSTVRSGSHADVRFILREALEGMLLSLFGRRI